MTCPPPVVHSFQEFILELDYIAGRPAAVLFHKRSQHIVNAFIWPAAKQEGQALRNPTLQGTICCGGRDQG